ncbi:hypothetical protein RKE29_00830 [Streptomyces sp. B1866]|uniref:DUF7144 family membrane protein n=1 Tax=Streptomyces sp. B1866 TaxID=3075431 RepID=UPI00289296FB|nr:hypothetical protein [Streptomyces sp. B1866]MDT3395209.1 hypothetical protein [Streptomyces sp. B1866]
MMSQTTHPHYGGSQALAFGLATFAAVMLIVAGALDILRGVMAVLKDDIYVTTPHYAVEFDLAGWGWVHVALGILAVLVGLGLFRLSLWARVAGVAAAALLMVANFLSLPYYPVWSIVLIALYAFVIWALCVVRPEEAD